MTDFRVVPDDLRGLKATGRPRSPMTLELLDGKTVFMPGAKQTSYSGLAARYGKRSNTRVVDLDGESGLLIWWTDKEGAA